MNEDQSAAFLVQRDIPMGDILRLAVQALRMAEPEIRDDGVCRYDHGGLCQEHALHEIPCPVGVVRHIASKAGVTASEIRGMR